MKGFASIFIFLLTLVQMLGQATSDIIVDSEFTNHTDNVVVRVIREGEIISNVTNSYKYQMLAIYDVIPSKYVVKVDDQWLVEVPPNSKIPISVKTRCLNQGLKIPPAESLVPTGFQFNQGQGLETQVETWKTVERSKGIIEYDVTGSANDKDCIEAVKAALLDMLQKHAIIASFNNSLELLKEEIDCGSFLRDLEFDLVTVPTKIPVRVINLRGKVSNHYDVELTGDIYIEPQFHKIFGR